MINISRVGSGRVGSGQYVFKSHGSGRVGSGQEVSKSSRIRSLPDPGETGSLAGRASMTNAVILLTRRSDASKTSPSCTWASLAQIRTNNQHTTPLLSQQSSVTIFDLGNFSRGMEATTGLHGNCFAQGPTVEGILPAGIRQYGISRGCFYTGTDHRGKPSRGKKATAGNLPAGLATTGFSRDFFPRKRLYLGASMNSNEALLFLCLYSLVINTVACTSRHFICPVRASMSAVSTPSHVLGLAPNKNSASQTRHVVLATP